MREELASALLSELSSRRSPSKRISLDRTLAEQWFKACGSGRTIPADYKLDFHTRDGSRVIGAWPKDVESLGAGTSTVTLVWDVCIPGEPTGSKKSSRIASTKEIARALQDEAFMRRLQGTLSLIGCSGLLAALALIAIFILLLMRL